MIFTLKYFIPFGFHTNGASPISDLNVCGLRGIVSLLLQLILYPERMPKRLTRSRTAGIETSGLVRVSKMSSAYILILYLYPFSSTPWMAQTSGSRAMIKSRGETGQPCLTPHCKEKG